ncbi:hypothetical protein BEL04_07085 [Mucilaginibacter sp. PPCGB 2223]|uniref:hypothetical protein n=1 Tax=Mucilaginibacter sp. PPCGB 2223 TaxID=1886027 RepID=UPI0008261599|nr:hypothetical protein [Mucilaginibacter sp. PPCGB 2223]OCX54031.1 hypothetical protein BEL04_07085 [Mucilaginibacter sp. PPCGB 2223]
MIAQITTIDYLLLPFYLVLIYKLAYHYRDKFYPDHHPFKPYFIPGLTAKIAGAIFIGLIYNYYYQGGDTFNFFFHAKIINSTLISSPGTWFRLITHTADQSIYADSQALSDMFWYDDVSAYSTSCLGAVIGIFCFTKYLEINVIVASLSFVGMWLMFLTFAQQYKTITKYIAIAVLFMPGPIVWGAGLFKDSFCMFAIGALIYSMYLLFEKGTLKLSLVLLAAFSITLLWLIKAYILIALFPILIFKIILVHKKRVALHPERKLIFYIALIGICFIGYKAAKAAANYLSDFSTENVLEKVKIQKDYLLRVSLDSEGSAYDLGDFEPTIRGISKMIIPAINVTLFRPYIRESKSAIQLFNALESTGVILLTLYMIIKRNILKTVKKIYKDPNLIMCLFFTLVFAFFVGVSSYNFGSLSRYKIPCTPFYILFLIIIIFDRTTSADNLPAGKVDN